MKTYRQCIYLFFLLIYQAGVGQINCYNSPYNLWVVSKDSIEVRGKLHPYALETKGTLHSMKDSSIMFHRADYGSPYEIQSTDIIQFQSRKKGQIGIGAAIGTTAGLLVGIMIANGNSAKSSNSISGAFGAEIGEGFEDAGTILLSTAIGASIGIVIGTSSKKMTINGSQKRYTASRKQLKRYQCQSHLNE